MDVHRTIAFCISVWGLAFSYSNPELNFQIRSAGITHMLNYPEIYFESIANMSRDNYIQEMSKQGTSCDNIIIQAVTNALSCTIHN